MLDQFLNKRKTPIVSVIHLDTSKFVAMTRIIERGRTSGRKDDTKEAFPTRWAAYQTQTVPSLNYFQSKGKVSKIDAEQTIDEVYAEIQSIIKEL